MTLPEVESAVSRSFVQEVVREGESSPLSTSPSAKIIKIEEITDVPSHSAEQLVELFHYCLKPTGTFFIVGILSEIISLGSV